MKLDYTMCENMEYITDRLIYDGELSFYFHSRIGAERLMYELAGIYCPDLEICNTVLEMAIKDKRYSKLETMARGGK